VVFMPDGGLLAPGLGVFSVRPVGDGGWAVGENGLSLRYEGGEWVRRDDGSSLAGFKMGHIINLNDGTAVATGQLPDGDAGAQWLRPDGGTSLLPLPPGGDEPRGAALMADGRVLVCRGTGELLAGTPSTTFVPLASPLNTCASLLTAADGGLYAGATVSDSAGFHSGLVRLSLYSPSVVQVGAMYSLGRVADSIHQVRDGLLIGAADNAIIRLYP
jgi:hypothetical protein